MISFPSIWAIVIRHMRILLRDPNVLLYLYWPVLDILIWGYLGSWIQKLQMAQFKNYEVAALLGILLWQVAGRGANTIMNAFNEELWSNNVINLFSMPIRITEWIAGVILFYAIMVMITTITCMSVIFMLYDVSLWYLFSTFLVFCHRCFSREFGLALPRCK